MSPYYYCDNCNIEYEEEDFNDLIWDEEKDETICPICNCEIDYYDEDYNG